MMYRGKVGATAPVENSNVICSQTPGHVIFRGNSECVCKGLWYQLFVSSDFQATVGPRRTHGPEVRAKVCLRDPNTGHLVSNMRICSVTRWC